MQNTKTESFVYEGFGFPIKLINAPMKKVFGEWVMDINFAELQRFILFRLTDKKDPLTGGELRFIRHYFGMSTHQFGIELGVSHVSILHWENEERKMYRTNEKFLRIYILNRLIGNDKKFRTELNNCFLKTFHRGRAQQRQLEINAEKIAC